jgi:hypothetical protein
MERIDRNNYESFFIDYLDGSLPVGEIDLLLDFLTENPDLADELKNLEKIKLQPPIISDFDVEHLKKTDLDLAEVFEETCIRAIENELSPSELQNFQEYLTRNEERQKTLELFQSTLSEPDPFIIYDQKNSLKKKTIGFRYWYAVAAILILGLMFFLPSDQKPTLQSKVQVAQTIEATVSKPVEVKGEIQTNPVLRVVKKHTPVVKPKIVKVSTSEKSITPVFIEPLKPIFAEVQIDQVFKDEMKLALVEKKVVEAKNDYSKYLTIKEFIAQKINGMENKGTIEKVALKTLKKVSGDKFDYSTTNKGKINKLEFNSQLIAFSIPVNRKE